MAAGNACSLKYVEEKNRVYVIVVVGRESHRSEVDFFQ